MTDIELAIFLIEDRIKWKEIEVSEISNQISVLLNNKFTLRDEITGLKKQLAKIKGED